MPIVWTDDLARIDWDKVSALYRGTERSSCTRCRARNPSTKVSVSGAWQPQWRSSTIPPRPMRVATCTISDRVGLRFRQEMAGPVRRNH